jgi:iron complex outermembrane receptor protein
MKARFDKRHKVHKQAAVYLAVSLALVSGLSGQVAASEPVGEGGAEASVLDLKAEPVYELEAFTVVAERFGEVGDFSLQSIQVLEAGELQRQLQATLGETLAWEPGLNASYFGPGASRPVIRGLGDYRVRMLVDDIGTLDVSDNSPDHGVPLEPLLVRRVDIHRGPDALIFGNAAIGGAINSQTRYLPDHLPEEALSGAVETRYETGSEGRSTAVYGTARAGDFALRATGARRSADAYKIPGRARSDDYEKTFSPVVNNPVIPLSEPVPNPEGTVPNTYIDTETASVGGLWVPESGRGRLGIAYSRYESSYGVPYQYGGDPNELFGDTGLEMRQSRLDVEAALDLDLERFERVRLRLGRADYSHEETFTGRAKNAGKVFQDTTMGLDSTELRLDLYHRLFDGLEGVVGVHGFKRELEASRLTAPPDEASRKRDLFDTRNHGAFLVETWTAGAWTLRGGYRYERQTIEDLSLAGFGVTKEATAESHSLAFGVTWRDYQRWGLDEVALTANASRIERLPSETERYAFWSNAAIQRFIIGADNAGAPLEVERSNAFEFGFELHKGDWSGRLNVYRYDFKDFIFLQDIKGIGNLAQYVAKDALFHGGEAELTWRLHEDATTTFRLKGMVDWVRGENQSDDTYLPRIPPLRIGSRLEYEADAWVLGAELRYAFAQERVQEESDVPELETDSYLELNLDASYAWTLSAGELSIFARATNLLDAERRTHVSFLKDVAPLPGRSLSLGARWSF